MTYKGGDWRCEVPPIATIPYSGSLSEQLALCDALILSDFPTATNGPLLETATSLGELSDEGINTPSARAEDGYVHAICSRRRPALDTFGHEMVSTSSDQFDLHTDEYFSLSPARYVLLLCVRPSAIGGETVLSSSTDFLDHLTQGDLDELSRPAFPAPYGSVPLLDRRSGRWRIRFNLIEMQRAAGGNLSMTPAQRRAVERLRRAANANAVTLKLGPADCLVLRNDRVLHGRKSFPACSDRLLKRVRIK